MIEIETLNFWGERAMSVAWPMLWQASVLIALLLVLDFALRRKVRAAVRHALWLVVLVKLVLPPSLALPTGAGWWLRPSVRPEPPRTTRVVVKYGPLVAPSSSPRVSMAIPAGAPQLSLAGGLLAGWGLISLGLLGWMLFRWRRITRQLQNAAPAPEWLIQALERARESLGLRHRVGLRLLDSPVSPAICGLFKPVILLPRSLLTQLAPAELRSVLLHELVHLRRGDVWVNCLQALMQIAYWWHPLVWVANNRIHRVREEAVDDAVMLALRDEAEIYAPTLLQVARLALQRPLASLALVGILESQSSLRQRIQRLLDFHAPRKAGLTLGAALCVVAFGAVAVPMGKSPPRQVEEKMAVEEVTNDSAVIAPGTTASNKAQAGVLVQSGKLLYEMGKLDEAELKLKGAIKQDPNNQAAYYYLKLVAEARYKRPQAPDNLGPARRVSPSPSRLRIYQELDKLRLTQFGCKNVPLSQVLEQLREQAKTSDPEKLGINFMLGEAAKERGSSLQGTKVSVDPPLANARLADVLDAIVKGAEQPLRYSLEDYGIVFSAPPKAGVPQSLYIRVFKVDTNTFFTALSSVTSVEQLPKLSPASRSSHTGPASAREMLGIREFFASIGVDLSPPKSVFYTYGEGSLIVRATLQDLDTIERAVQVLNTVPPQVNIKARFIELPEAEAEAFWREHPRTNRVAFPAVEDGFGSPPEHLPDLNGARLSQHYVENDLGSPVKHLLLHLSESEARQQLARWRSAPGVAFLVEPNVTTLSGRQMEVQLAELGRILTYTNSSSGALVTNEVPFGPVLDVTPTASQDGLAVQVVMTASVIEFLGFEDPNSFIPQGGAQGAKSAPVIGALPLPHFRVHKTTVNESVRDGETLVLGTPVDDKVGPTEKASRKHLLVLITPTLIDPAGNRIHDPSANRNLQPSTNSVGLW